jgi:hypothetical protein
VPRRINCIVEDCCALPDDRRARNKIPAVICLYRCMVFSDLLLNPKTCHCGVQ